MKDGYSDLLGQQTFDFVIRLEVKQVHRAAGSCLPMSSVAMAIVRWTRYRVVMLRFASTKAAYDIFRYEYEE
jgi:hypothetical protein